MASVFKPSLLQDFFVKNIGKFYAYDILAMILKFYWLTVKSKALDPLGSCQVTFCRQWVNESLLFARFSEHISETFQYFSWNLLSRKISSISCGRYKKFVYKCSSNPVDEAQSFDFDHFLRFLAFFKVSV